MTELIINKRIQSENGIYEARFIHTAALYKNTKQRIIIHKKRSVDDLFVLVTDDFTVKQINTTIRLFGFFIKSKFLNH